MHRPQKAGMLSATNKLHHLAYLVYAGGIQFVHSALFSREPEKMVKIKRDCGKMTLPQSFFVIIFLKF